MGDGAAGFEAVPSVKPLRWRDFPGLARRTFVSDRRTYSRERKGGRPLSARRVLRSAFPALREPIFVVGAPRSGTTFLGACLARVPGISYHFEPVATKAAARYVYEGHWSTGRARLFYRGVYSWLLRVHLDGDLRFAEKTPQNSFVIPFLAGAFPGSRFVHIIRDGRDATISYSKKPWLRGESASAPPRYEPGGYRHGPYARFWVEPERVREFETTGDLHRCAWAWRRFTESVLQAAEGLPVSRYHEVRYEDLIRAPQDESRRLLDFLQIQAPASRHALKAAVAEGKPDSIGRWKAELTDGGLREIEGETAGLLNRLGYAG